MAQRNLLLAIAAIISLPVLVASFGASQLSGIVIGAALILIGVVAWQVESRRTDDDTPSDRHDAGPGSR
jgi:hypothetical protein